MLVSEDESESEEDVERIWRTFSKLSCPATALTGVNLCHQIHFSSGSRIPDCIIYHTKQLDFLSLFWGDDIWQILVDMTNLRAAQTLSDTPTDYYVRKWTDVDVPEMKAFFGVRISMENAVVKHRYEHYFSDKPGFLFSTPG